MKRLRFFTILLLTCLILSCAKAQDPAIESDPIQQPEITEGLDIKVLSYNVHHCNPPSKPGLIDVDGIAKVILDSNADLIGLQEIDVNNERSGMHLDQAAKLAELTEMKFYFSKGIDYKGGAYGTAILSKYPISEMETIHLPEEAGTERRTLSVLTVELPGEVPVRFGNIHLDFTSDTNALAQAKAITTYFEKEELPIILVGDFNVEASSMTMAHLDRTFDRTCEQGCPNTIPVVTPRKAIDFILYSKGFEIQTMFHEVIQEHYASDHLPVLAKLRL
ncbi:endonuclease/exonuclease/phosphatase family protein [Algoriphagus sp. D3-2-R+10]|uniref:endonuclease/exonuclease/phosphatase family protein n=1 Tax=Algoriphagus aurantiacus TaxID=3103948 RepID=UPI002B3C1F19|nr:endonuclease/exonuclease/phosphatase family protein [Algoriphagus sp. D3-2-R+10]MEB2775385.1 endonuclease/exonuclease/phosphatase family protein [Algoriphagus sp. D3-2-R+10]